MNLILKRTDYLPGGIFGVLLDEAGTLQAYTLEHAYQSEGTWQPKLPHGTYTCKRGQHALHSGPIETFEVTGVAGHSGILIHPGNTEEASEGCILVGSARTFNSDSRPMGLLESRAAFNRFLSLEAGQDEFILTVED